jgi:hypothetical protein
MGSMAHHIWQHHGSVMGYNYGDLVKRLMAFQKFTEGDFEDL